MLRSLFTFILGWVILQGVMSYAFRNRRTKYAGDRRHFLVTQGGGQFRPGPSEVDNAVASVMMGGLILDLRGMSRGAGPKRLDVLVLMGGVQIVAPDDWNVQLAVRPILGGVRDARHGAVIHGEPDLIITGRALMGGLDITSEVPQVRAGKDEENRAAA